MTKITVEFWPREEVTFQVDEPKDMVENEVGLFVCSWVHRTGYMPGGREFVTAGQEFKFWVKEIAEVPEEKAAQA